MIDLNKDVMTSKIFPALTPLRLLLASFVTWSHCYPLTLNEDPIARVTGQIDGGNIGVWGFFYISGYLVTQSYRRSPYLGTFIINRFLRIWPALILAVLTSICLAWITSNADTRLFLAGALDYAKHNLTLIKGVAYLLPGSFADAPYPSVNGSLWTLPWELRLYVLISLLGAGGVLGNRALTNLALLFCTAFVFFLSNISTLSVFLDNPTVPHMLLSFLLGVTVCINVDTDRDLRLAPIVLAGVAAVLFLLGATKFGWLFIICAAVGFLGFTEILRFKFWKADISYGVYIYSFPIQQFFIHQFATRKPILVFLTVMPIIVVIAYLSWRFIEFPCLKLKTLLKINKTIN